MPFKGSYDPKLKKKTGPDFMDFNPEADEPGYQESEKEIDPVLAQRMKLEEAKRREAEAKSRYEDYRSKLEQEMGMKQGLPQDISSLQELVSKAKTEGKPGIAPPAALERGLMFKPTEYPEINRLQLERQKALDELIGTPSEEDEAAKKERFNKLKQFLMKPKGNAMGVRG